MNQIFIGREEQIIEISRFIDQEVAPENRGIIFIDGNGGVGKTSLLIKIYESYLDDNCTRVLKPFDFDDPAYDISSSFWGELAEILDKEAFREYFSGLNILAHLSPIDGGEAVIVKQREKIIDLYVEVYNSLSEKKRILIMLDTCERIDNDYDWTMLLSIFSRLSNTVLIIAARPEANIYEKYIKEYHEITSKSRIKLDPLDKNLINQYIQKKENRLHFRISEQLRANIAELSQGYPLIADLCLEWVRYNIAIPILEYAAGKDRTRAEIIDQLVEAIIYSNLDHAELLWLMAFVWPINKEMAAHITGWPPKKIDPAWERAISFSFVKKIRKSPNDEIFLSLHDVFREYIIDYLQKEYGRNGVIEIKRTQKWFNNAINHLRAKRLSVQNQLADVISQESPNPDKRFQSLRLERELLELDGSYITFLMLLNQEEGCKEFVERFDKLTEQYPFIDRSVITNRVIRFLLKANIKLTNDQYYELHNRFSRHFLDQGDIERAKVELEDLLKRSQDNVFRLINIYVLLANVIVRRGNFLDAINKFNEALQLCNKTLLDRNNQHIYNLQIAKIQVLNGLGWVHRLTGNLSGARSNYNEAISLADEIQDTKRLAYLYNNLAYVQALEGNHHSAIELCHTAETYWRELKFDRGLGSTFSTLGCVYMEANNIDEAIKYLTQALVVFEPGEDNEWLSTVCWELGKAYWLKNDLVKAETYLLRAQKLGKIKDRHIVEHYLGELRLSQGQLDQAKELFESSYSLARDVQDPYYIINCLGDLARVAFMREEYDLRDKFRNDYDNFQVKHNDKYPLPQGLLKRYLADLYMVAGDFESASDYYCEAFVLIAHHGSYDPYTIIPQLQQVEDNVLRNAAVPRTQMVRLGEILNSKWKQSGLDETCPEASAFFRKWMKGGK